MKFDNPIEQKLNDDISLLVPSAWLNPRGFPTIEAQIWNGTLMFSDTLCLASDSARARFIRSAVERIPVTGNEIESALLLISGNLTTVLADNLKADSIAQRGQSQATMLVELAEGAELFHSPDGDAFASIKVDNHTETWPVRTRGFKRWLMKRFYEQTKTSASTQAVQDAIGALEGKALFDGKQHSVHTRIAELAGHIYIDLANEGWEVIEISSTGWRVVAEPPVKFRRSRGMLPLPHPVLGGSIDNLRPYVNICSDRDWTLLCAWLVQALRPRGHYPVLVVHGDQGSAKSTLSRLLRMLVDPNTAPLRSEPREVRDLMIAATNGWLVALDNLSRIQEWLSDAICRLATGGGFATRELYSDAEEVLFDAQRPVLINGIEELATRSDLLDRAIILYLPSIPEERRMKEGEFWEEFEAARPRILGALCDAVSAALRNFSTIRLERLPRMADFAQWASAAEVSLGFVPGTFIKAYSGNRESANELALESSAVASFVRSFVEEEKLWTGTATELLVELNTKATEAIQRQKEWPKNGRSLSDRLRRISSNLRAASVAIEFGSREGRKRDRMLRLEWIGKSASFASAPSAESETVEEEEFGREATADANRAADANEQAHTDFASASQGSQTNPNSKKTQVEADNADAPDAADAKKHKDSNGPALTCSTCGSATDVSDDGVCQDCWSRYAS